MSERCRMCEFVCLCACVTEGNVALFFSRKPTTLTWPYALLRHISTQGCFPCLFECSLQPCMVIYDELSVDISVYTVLTWNQFRYYAWIYGSWKEILSRRCMTDWNVTDDMRCQWVFELLLLNDVLPEYEHNEADVCYVCLNDAFVRACEWASLCRLSVRRHPNRGRLLLKR